MLAAKYEELEELQAWRTELRRRAKSDDYNCYKVEDQLKNVALDIADTRKIIRALHNESQAFAEVMYAEVL